MTEPELSHHVGAVAPIQDPDAPVPVEPAAQDLFAAIDLGSNSFHMVIARLAQGEMRVVETLGEKVQQAAGLDKRGYLSTDAQQRGLDCLGRFAQRLVGLPPQSVRVVGTNTLRAARNRQEFIYRARQVLGHPIEIISGREEARLIYLGVAHGLPAAEGKRLAVDIGGGSTEFIIGEWYEPLLLESLHMGCVGYMGRFFPDGKISEENMRRAEAAARLELVNIEQEYRRIGWEHCVGSSGTIKAAHRALAANGWSNEGITREGLASLRKAVLKNSNCADIQIEGVTESRRLVLPAGLAILSAVFEAFSIKRMDYSESALREGVLQDLLGRHQHEDVRERTINAMQERHHVDVAHAHMVEHTAQVILSQVESTWKLTDPVLRDWLRWAVRLHEIGMAISHTQFHKHGAYLVEYSDLTGFSRSEQLAVALLVRGHRRKIPLEEFAQFPEHEREVLMYLCVVMRLAILLHHSRAEETLPVFALKVKKRKITMQFADGWLDAHPLTRADLDQEAKYLKKIDISLDYE